MRTILLALSCCIICSYSYGAWENSRTGNALHDSDWDNLGVIDPLTGAGYTDDNLDNYYCPVVSNGKLKGLITYANIVKK